MIRYTKGDILQSSAQAIVNTVNTVGVMGKGLALQFKTSYPENFKIYKKACDEGRLSIGQMLITTAKDLFGKDKLIVNFPTKTTWRKPSEYIYIEQGLKTLKQEILSRGITSIAIPPLGSRNGGLDWNRVRQMIEMELVDLDCDIILYEPSEQIIERLDAEKTKLTPARAMLLDVICNLVANGEFASEFAAEKIVYFLQRFGAQDIFKVKFQRSYYGPYSGKVRHVLRYMNGSYIMGMAELQQKPFEPIWILANSAKDAHDYLCLQDNTEYTRIAEDVKQFLSGYYSNFTLELLATLDYILITDPRLSGWYNQNEQDVVDLILTDIANWSNRKEKLFSNTRSIHITLTHLKEAFLQGKLKYC